jgi:NitT/TauT family transport system permease protein
MSAAPVDLGTTAGSGEAVQNGLFRRLAGGLGAALPGFLWGVASVAIFVAIWELAWLVGWADARLLPPPHIFLGNLPDQARFFMSAERWRIGVGEVEAPSGFEAVALTVLASTARVFAGLFIATIVSLVVGVAIRYWKLCGNLLLPTITLLAPVSPIAWLPVAIFAFGIGNKPAVFMVFIALFFIMVLSTITQIDSVEKKYIDVARIMGATKRQLYFRVILPAILPGLLVVLRLNLFAAWMVVLVAEATGVGYGLGQVIMVARNMLNPSLIFFTIVLIGALGFFFDFVLRIVQRRVLYWVPKGYGALG